MIECSKEERLGSTEITNCPLDQLTKNCLEISTLEELQDRMSSRERRRPEEEELELDQPLPQPRPLLLPMPSQSMPSKLLLPQFQPRRPQRLPLDHNLFSPTNRPSDHKPLSREAISTSMLKAQRANSKTKLTEPTQLTKPTTANQKTRSD